MMSDRSGRVKEDNGRNLVLLFCKHYGEFLL